MQTSPLLESLMEALRCLPGVGPKSAQRMAFHLLQRNRSGGMQLAQALTRAMSEIGDCQGCRTFTEKDHCSICTNPRRQQTGQICVVESPADIYAIEQTGQFAGRYFVLMGHLSPLDGIGPLAIAIIFASMRKLEIEISSCQSVSLDIAIERIFTDRNPMFQTQPSTDNGRRSMCRYQCKNDPLASVKLIHQE